MPVSRSQLRSALLDRALCRIDRARFKDREYGYIVGVGPQWLLAAVVGSGYRMDGFRAYRICDISRLQNPLASPSFIPEAHRLFRISPPKIAAVELSSISALLGSIPAKYGPIALHTESSKPDVCYIGTVQRVSAHQVWLREITPSAEWEDTHTPYRLSDVTRVDVGDEYSRALLDVSTARRAAERGRRGRRGSA